MSDNSGIYLIKNNKDNKCYLGSSKNLKTRKNTHLSKLRNNKHCNIHLQRAFNRDGEDCFYFEVLEYVEPEFINDIEQMYLDCMDFSTSYNLSQAGFSVSNYSSSPQIILNSGRLVFNSSTDSIGLTSGKQILLGAREKIYLESKETSLVSRKIYLGSEDATEPLLLGNKTIELLFNIFVSLQSLANALPSVGTPVPGAPNIAVASTAADLSATLSQLIPQLESLKSKQNFTK
jgi:group I intron endonuclease